MQLWELNCRNWNTTFTFWSVINVWFSFPITFKPCSCYSPAVVHTRGSLKVCNIHSTVFCVLAFTLKHPLPAVSSSTFHYPSLKPSSSARSRPLWLLFFFLVLCPSTSSSLKPPLNLSIFCFQHKAFGVCLSFLHPAFFPHADLSPPLPISPVCRLPSYNLTLPFISPLFISHSPLPFHLLLFQIHLHLFPPFPADPIIFIFPPASIWLLCPPPTLSISCINSPDYLEPFNPSSPTRSPHPPLRHQFTCPLRLHPLRGG